MLLQSPALCSSDSTMQHYKKLPSNFFIVNGRAASLKTPHYNASQHAPSFSRRLCTASSLLKALRAIQMSTFTYCFLPHY